jgi:hypothetical protein
MAINVSLFGVLFVEPAPETDTKYVGDRCHESV